MGNTYPRFFEGVALNEWIGEINERLGTIIKFRLKRIIKTQKSRYYTIVVAETEPLGKVLLFGEGRDVTIQSAEYYDFYDEMLTHIPMAAHPKPRKILIIGGGDGIVLREVLKYDAVKSVVIVEIDKEVIEVSRKYLKLDNGAFDDPRVSIIIDDAAEYISTTKEMFDVIIGDYSDPYQDLPAGSLIEGEFYRNVHSLLMENGIMAVQAGSPIFQREILKKIYANASKVFDVVKVYWAPVIYYPGAVWTFIVATKGLDPTIPRNPADKTIYYNPSIHRAAFVLPRYIEEIIGGMG